MLYFSTLRPIGSAPQGSLRTVSGFTIRPSFTVWWNSDCLEQRVPRLSLAALGNGFAEQSCPCRPGCCWPPPGWARRAQRRNTACLQLPEEQGGNQSSHWFPAVVTDYTCATYKGKPGPHAPRAGYDIPAHLTTWIAVQIGQGRIFLRTRQEHAPSTWFVCWRGLCKWAVSFSHPLHLALTVLRRAELKASHALLKWRKSHTSPLSNPHLDGACTERLQVFVSWDEVAHPGGSS